MSEEGPAPAPGSGDPVECHSGFEYAERPTALRWEGERLEITEILAQWQSPGGKRFQVRVSDGRLFELFYDEHVDSWKIDQI